MEEGEEAFKSRTQQSLTSRRYIHVGEEEKWVGGVKENKNKRQVKCESMSNNIGYGENLESLRLRQVGRCSDDERLPLC